MTRSARSVSDTCFAAVGVAVHKTARHRHTSQGDITNISRMSLLNILRQFTAWCRCRASAVLRSLVNDNANVMQVLPAGWAAMRYSGTRVGTSGKGRGRERRRRGGREAAVVRTCTPDGLVRWRTTPSRRTPAQLPQMRDDMKRCDSLLRRNCFTVAAA
jgi:hypothetical protein